MIGGIEETSASFEARSAPRSYPTAGAPSNGCPYRNHAMQERLKAIIAGFGCKPASPDYLRLLSADATEGGPSKVLELRPYRARNREFESISLQR